MALAAAAGLFLFALGSNPKHITRTAGVTVPVYMKDCTTDDECGHVETACSACCDYAGINKAYIEEYFAVVFGPACRTYRGAVCDCAFDFARHQPACVNGACTMTAGGTAN